MRHSIEHAEDDEIVQSDLLLFEKSIERDQSQYEFAGDVGMELQRISKKKGKKVKRKPKADNVKEVSFS